MKLKPHPLYDRIVALLRTKPLRYRKWSGLGFRSVTLEYAGPEKLLDGKGSLRHGARWTPPGGFPSVSLSLDQRTSIAEAPRIAHYYGLREEALRPRVLYAVDVRLQRVIDLTSLPSRLRPLVSLAELLSEDWRKINDADHESTGQGLARAFHDSDCEGLIVPSAASASDKNLVVFNRCLLHGSSLEICGEDEASEYFQ